MRLRESIYLHHVCHGQDPVKVAQEIFETHNFGHLEVVGVSGAETTIPYDHLDEKGQEIVEVKIPFFAKYIDHKTAELQSGDSIACQFCVQFDPKGTLINVYEKN